MVAGAQAVREQPRDRALSVTERRTHEEAERAAEAAAAAKKNVKMNAPATVLTDAERAARDDRAREEIYNRKAEQQQMADEADEQRWQEMYWMNAPATANVPMPAHVRRGRPWYGVDNADVPTAQDRAVPH